MWCWIINHMASNQKHPLVWSHGLQWSLREVRGTPDVECVSLMPSLMLLNCDVHFRLWFLIDFDFLLKTFRVIKSRCIGQFVRMDSVPSDLSPPQLFYLMVVVLRAIAQQAGVFLSPVDAAWEQSVPDGTRSAPAGCTIGDNSTLRTALQCVEISDSDEEPDQNVKSTGSTPSGENASPNVVGPREPPYPPPIRSRRQRSTSSGRENPRTKRGRKWDLACDLLLAESMEKIFKKKE